MSWLLVAYVVFAYLLGGIPFGLLIGRKVAHVDVRQVGSGNIGATNVARAAGKKLGVLTLALDALKGLLPTLGMYALAQALAPEAPRDAWVAATGLAAFLGHCYSPYLGLRGGKGVATAFGVLLAMAPWGALAGFAAYAIVYGVWRISSAGSLVATLVVPLVVVFTGTRVEAIAVLVIVAVVLWKHRSNVRRLLARSEGRV